MGPTRATEKMRALGADLFTSRPPLGLFVTHHHGDHAAHAFRSPAPCERRSSRTQACRSNRAKRVEVRAVRPGSAAARSAPSRSRRCQSRTTRRTSRFASRRAAAASASRPTSGTRRASSRALLQGCDLVMLEANHCPAMLEAGPVPAPAQAPRRRAPRSPRQRADCRPSPPRSRTRACRAWCSRTSRGRTTPPSVRWPRSARRLRRLPVEALLHGEPRSWRSTAAGRLASAEQLGFGF